MDGARRQGGPDGLLILDKPGGITSRAALDRALAAFPRGTRMGHTGTLDPLATGVLVLCLGNATRLAEYVQRMPKIYRTNFQLGVWSTTDDADGVITTTADVTPPDSQQLGRILDEFVGKIDQVPPRFSAAKVAGRRAYAMARAGSTVTLAPRQVEIYRIRPLSYSYPSLIVDIHCGKGTYIRSIARDLGERLGCGALVQRLQRLHVGPFAIHDAVSSEAEVEKLRASVLPPEAALADLPRMDLGPNEEQRFLRGQAVPMPGGVRNEGEVAVFDTAGRLAGIASFDVALQLLVPRRVFPKS
jgi:tRNA pseudouridine55 synthase